MIVKLKYVNKEKIKELVFNNIIGISEAKELVRVAGKEILSKKIGENYVADYNSNEHIDKWSVDKDSFPYYRIKCQSEIQPPVEIGSSGSYAIDYISPIKDAGGKIGRLTILDSDDTIQLDVLPNIWLDIEWVTEVPNPNSLNSKLTNFLS